MPVVLGFVLGCLTGLISAEGAPEEGWEALPGTKVGADIVDAIESHPDLTYARYGERELQLDLFRPKNVEGLLPAIVCIHGGGWQSGDRRNHAHLAKALAARGFVAVSISYRLSGEEIFPAQIEDAKAAVRWLRANAEEWGIDSEHIGATGLSAGGHLVALLSTSDGVEALEGEGGHADFSSTIQAAVPMGAQSDFMSERNREKSKEAEIWQKFLGGTQEEVPETYRLASPRQHLGAGDPPTFFLSGEFDDPSTHADEARGDYVALGIPTGLLVIPGAPHPFLTKQKFFDIAIDQMDAFFTLHLKGGGIGPIPGENDRIGWSADGNKNDPDDWGATAMALAIFAKQGWQDKLVHVDYNNWLAGNTPEKSAEETISVVEGIERFGFTQTRVFDNQTHLEAAIESAVEEINKSGPESRFWYVQAGPFEVAYRALEKAEPEKRKYVVLVSHSEMNERADKWEGQRGKDDCLALGAEYFFTSPQGKTKFGSGSFQEWHLVDWMRNSSNPDYRWVYSRMKKTAEHKRGVLDASDGGMAYVLATGDEDGNFDPKLREFLGADWRTR